MNCDRTDCIHYKVCEEWKSLGNDNYINDSYGNCEYYAPTVEMPKHSLLPLAGDCDEAYMRGYEIGKAEGILKAHARQKGEWIKVKEDRMSIDMSGEIATRYKCSKCGRMIATFPSKLADYPFCHCGADMRGKKNES